MTSEGGKTSPELEFGTFLRLPHQTRTFSRPADSYIPSSPPSRPTSPTPASPPPPSVFLHGRPAPIVGKMRQGAPRLGGLGLGGILETPSPAKPPSAPAPPPLPARRQPSPSSARPIDSSLPPAIPPAMSISSSSRSASPASSLNGRPQTPNSAKVDPGNGGGSLPLRPFLSPEMDRPTAREGAFALDRPKVQDVLKKSTEDDAPSEPEQTPSTHSDNGRDGGLEFEKASAEREELGGAGSPEAFPSPDIAENEHEALFDRFHTNLGREREVRSGAEEENIAEAEGDSASDGASVRSTGESFFATPETVAASKEEEESIPDFVLEAPLTIHPPGDEEIAFDGPPQLATEEVREENPLRSSTELDTFHDDTSQVMPSRRVGNSGGDSSARQLAPLPWLSDALLSRADKSADSDGSHRSPAASVATSVYESREPSVHQLDLERDEEEEVASESDPHTGKPSLLLATAPLSAFPSSPTYSQTSSLPDELSSPSYASGSRQVEDPAALYPSPPSSPATSIQASPLRSQQYGLPDPDDLPVNPVDGPTKLSSNDTEFVEEVSLPAELHEVPSPQSPPQSPSPVEDTDAQGQTSTLPGRSTPPAQIHHVDPISSVGSRAAVTSASSSINSPTTFATPPPSALSPLASSPYFDRSTTSAPRRPRFSYQGLGLRMPSSISPKSAMDEAPPADIAANRKPTSLLQRSADTERESTSTERKDDAAEPTPSIFAWARPLSTRASPRVGENQEERTTTEEGSGYHDEAPSSPSAYAPSSAASSPEIAQAQRVPIVPPATAAVVTSWPTLNRKESTSTASSTPSFDTTTADGTPPVSTAEPDADVETSKVEEVEPMSAPARSDPLAEPVRSTEEPEPEDPDQVSTIGVAVDIGTAVAGALVMGGLAVGQSAWRGLAVGWSTWRGASNQPVIQETKVLEVSNLEPGKAKEEEEKEFKSYARPKDIVEESEEYRKAESSVISTEWGEAEFDAPEGFFEEFKRAMAEIGEEDLAANEQAQIDAQLAAYQTASRQHVDAISSPTLTNNSFFHASPASPSVSFPSTRAPRPRESSVRHSQVATIQEDSADEDERELEELMAPVWDSPSRRSRVSVEFPTQHGFAVPPGLTGSPSIGGRPTSVISTSSVGSRSMRSSQASAAPPPPRQPAKLSKTSKGILGFGRSKSTKNVSKSASRIAPSPSLPGLSKSQSVLSKESSTVNDDANSQHSKSSSHKTAGRRSSIFNFGGQGKDIPPVPTIESQIKDTTYISYGSSNKNTPKAQRRTSNASIPAGLYASRDPYLITPDAPGSPAPPIGTNPATTRRTREATPSSIVTNSSRSTAEDLGGAPLGRRKSSLRSTSAYDGSSSQLTRSSSIIVEGGKKLYRVRFGNAVGGIGLRSVADSEAERAGGDRYGQRWVGVGRGRYGNMVIKTDEESDMVYAEQVAQIKKKWRAFGSEQSRDWAAVRIDK